MSNPLDLNKAFSLIMERIIATGKAPDYTEIAAGLGGQPLEGKMALRKLFKGIGFPGWFKPKTDTILSFAPFMNEPNNYHLTIDGEQKWFGQ